MKKFYGLSLLMTFILLFGMDASAQTFGWSSNGYLSSLNTVSGNNQTTNYNNYYIPADDPLYLGDNNAGNQAYLLKNAAGEVTFTTTSKLSNVTIGVFLTYNTSFSLLANLTSYNIEFDGKSKSLGISTNDLTRSMLNYYVGNYTTYKLVTITQVEQGTHTISYGNLEVGLFYILEESTTSAEVSGEGAFSLDNYVSEMGDKETLGVWKAFKYDGLSLYLGGWKYQANAALADMYDRHSQYYLNPNYDPENDIDEDGQVGLAEQRKKDDWEHPEELYAFGTEDPYYYTDNCKTADNASAPTKSNYTVTQPAYQNYTRYAYNTVDNGRNEYIENGYTGKYSFSKPQMKEDKTYGKEALLGDPFTVPCIGDFIKLEPDLDGTVTLYLMQNGTLEFNTKDYRKNYAKDSDGKVTVNELFTPDNSTYYGKWHGGLMSKVCWRPVYIVDEAGTRLKEGDVKAETNTYITIGRGDEEAYVYDSDDKNQKTVLCEKNNGDYIIDNTNGWYVTDTNGNIVTKNGSMIKVKRSTYASCVNALGADNASAEDQAHYKFFTSKFNVDGTDYEVWPENVTRNTNGTTNAKARVWGPEYTGDGWVVISKGYVKYTFDVKAGKSYYIFSNDTKIGFSGFEFTNTSVPNGDVTLNDDVDINDQPIEDGQSYGKVTLNRKFHKGWNTICLPFSVNESQMRKWFGTDGKETYELVTYNGVGIDKEDGKLKAFFFHHVYQDIIAGYPYMLYIPEGALAVPTDDNPDQKVAFTNVTCELNAKPRKEFTNSNDYMPKDVTRLFEIATRKDFTFTGFYSPTSVETGDYYVIPDGLQLYNNKTPQKMRGFNAVMKLRPNSNGVKEMVRLSGTNYSNIIDDMESAWDEATVINEIAEEMGLLPRPSNIYNLNGQLVRQNSASLVGLPKGIYIVNGKKQLVK